MNDRGFIATVSHFQHATRGSPRANGGSLLAGEFAQWSESLGDDAKVLL
jgi:hypothetical protein